MKLSLSLSLILIWVIIGLTGCGRMIATMHQVPYDPQISYQAQQLLHEVFEKNPVPDTFKGIGNFRIAQNHQVEKGRMAWMASGSDKLRIEILTPYGQPGVGFSTDGQYAYAAVYSEMRFYKRTISGLMLKEFISISVKPEEIISLFRGRPPQVEYSFISMVEPEKVSGPMIVIQEKWWKGHQKIYLDKNADHIRAIEVYDGSGDMKYRADFSRFTTVNGVRLPYLLEISNAEGTTVELLVNRYWPHEKIDPSSFVIKPPGS